MAVGVLTSERVIADLDGCPDAPLSQQSRDALVRSPGAAAWAQSYTRDIAISGRTFDRQTAPAIVGYAVHGIAQACPNRDRVLHNLQVGPPHPAITPPGHPLEGASSTGKDTQ